LRFSQFKSRREIVLAFSGSAFPPLHFWSCIFQSCVFGRAFSGRAFSADPPVSDESDSINERTHADQQYKITYSIGVPEVPMN